MRQRDGLLPDRRLLVLAPTRRDASITQELLATQRIPVTVCATVDALIEDLESGAAAVMIPEEAVSPSASARLRALLAKQPPWSDLPVLLLTRPGANSAVLAEAVRTLGNVTLLERPLQVTTLVSAIRTALRARDRQYQIRGHLIERAQAEEALHLADQRKDEFLATLGHELRNPLAPLMTGLQLLTAGNVTDPVVVRVTRIMERQIDHLVRLVDDLLEMSRITRGLIEIRREPIDLAFVVQSAIETSRSVIEAAGHQLSVDLPDEPIVIAGDTVRLTQVFSNLLTNAAKYTNAGGRVWLTVKREGATAVVSVRDNGIGISADHLGTVFDMFMQVDRSSRRAQGGLGIGLTLVHTLVTTHGGRVQARSAGLGEGSEFIVELPMLSHSLAADARPAALQTLPARRVLVVDDNVDAADSLGALLESRGAIPRVVNSGREALSELVSFQPNVVLLDIGMPEMDGYEVARRIRSTPGQTDVLLVALSGWGQDEDYRQTRAAGFDHHLVKPPDLDQLCAVLKADHVRDTDVSPLSARLDRHPTGREG